MARTELAVSVHKRWFAAPLFVTLKYALFASVPFLSKRRIIKFRNWIAEFYVNSALRFGC